MNLSGEFWAAIAGALVGGGISAILQALANRSARKTRENEALARAKSQLRSLLFKVVKIESDFLHFRRHVNECRGRASENRMPFGWSSFIPLANTPRSITFTNDEMTALVELKDDSLFNELLSLDDIHSSILGLITLYREKRMALSESMPAEMDGSIGTITLTPQEYRALAPRLTEMDILANDIANLIERESSEPMSLSKRLVEKFNARFAANVSLQLTAPAQAVI